MATAEYDVWLWDLDGTLVDIEWSYVRDCFDEVGTRLGHEFTDRQASVIWNGLGGSRDDILESIGLDPVTFWPTFHAIEDPHRRAEATYLYDDATVVGDLEQPTGLVTHCQQFLTDPILAHLDIRDWFDTVVCCSDEVGWKPNPAPVERALQDIDPRSRHGVLIGDSASDVGAAWNAGLDGVHIERRSPRDRGYCVLGDYQVTEVDDVPGLNSG